MRTIAQVRRRFGYRRLHVLLSWEGYGVNHKKLFRFCREEKLAVRRRTGRNRAGGRSGKLLGNSERLAAETGGGAGAFDHAGDPAGAERPAPLRGEHERRLRLLLAL